MLPTLVYLGPRGARIRDVVATEDEVYFATAGDATTLWRAPQGYPAHAIATVEGARLLGVDEDGLVCLDRDHALVVRDRSGGSRLVLRVLEPAPIEIVVTPEHVVWCSAGEVWRWWRHGDRLERLGTHDAPRPVLAHRPVPRPYPPHRVAPDVAIAAGRRIGLIDAEGLEWIAEAAADVTQFACTSNAMVWTTGRHLTRCDLDSEAIDIAAELDGPTAALAARDDRVYLATNCVHLEAYAAIACTPPAQVSVFDLAGAGQAEAGPLRDPTWIRAAMALAPGPHGLYLVEREDDLESLTFLPRDWHPTQRDATLSLERWLPDGRGGQVMVAHGTWWSHGVTGEIPGTITARVNAWLRANHVNSERITRPPRPRVGWLAFAGNNLWSAAHGDRITINAIALDELATLLAPHVAPVARWMKLA